MRYFLLFLVIVIFIPCRGQSISQKNLFRIERSKDINSIFYDVNLTENGILNTSDPIAIYWVKYADKGQKKPLSWIQSKLAYGLHFIKSNENRAEFQFVSYNKRNFILMKDQQGQYNVYTHLNNKMVVVKRIFVEIAGGSFFVPKIPQVEVYGCDITGSEVLEIVKP